MQVRHGEENIVDNPVQLTKSTIERWYYLARKEQNPVVVLQKKQRKDKGRTKLSEELRKIIEKQYQIHPHWSYQLHSDNLQVLAKGLGESVSYHTVRRYMQAHQLHKKRKVKNRDTQGALLAQALLKEYAATGLPPAYLLQEKIDA
jgi:hypothetical protein